MKGYIGRILSIDLSSGEWKAETVGDDVYEKFLSGVGLGAWYLYQNIPAGADPMGPENILGFTSGLLTGTGTVMTGRWMAMCKSPLTGGWGDSNCGGNLAPAIKQCGYDAIFIKGQSKKPVYIFIDNKGPVIKDASAYWGLDTVEAEERLIKDNWNKKKPSVAVIGPASEKLSLISGISNDGGRFAARSGVGAVMGSKGLKALVLAGTKAVTCENPEAIKILTKEYARKVRKSNAPGIMGGWAMAVMGKLLGSMKSVVPIDGIMTVMLLKKWGTVMNNTMAIQNGDAPLKNWSGSDKDYKGKYSSSLNPDKFIAREERKYHCSSCIVGCGGICSIKDIRDGKYSHTHKPEYETAMCFGGLLMSKDTDSIFYANEICNRSGLDSISAGGVIAFAIECYENGILTKEDTGGLELTWGNSDSIISLLEKIAAREEGIGALLADGVKRAAEKIGKGSERFAVHAGGQELPMHDPKIDPMLGAVYSADPTPGRHTTSSGVYYTTSALWEKISWLPRFRMYPKAKEYINHDEVSLKNVAYTSYKMLIDGTGSCYYAMLMGVNHYKIFDYLNHATGWNLSADEYIEIGKRMQNMRQLFNIKQGVDPASFIMHARATGEEPLISGHNEGLKLDIQALAESYRRAWGWDEITAVPTSETLEKFGLKELVVVGGETAGSEREVTNG
ncbi:MAG: aldehyde ferredoxin oxidoreductase family protein [Spirochaetales bacterium]|nr:aldehyde ferredoxin oxidoreductase family protein [Spirochaetales bacterium]